MILAEATTILDLFIHYLNDFCAKKEQPFESQLKQLFPEKYLIDYEFYLLRGLLDENNVLYLETLLKFWKTYEKIVHICKGFKNLLAYYDISSNSNISVLQNMISINEETSSETCVTFYQNYCTHFANYCSESMLSLIAEWSESNDLFKFLHSVTATDIDDLFEVVDDWDETLINTKIVLDFVLLKRFFDKASIMIKSARAEKCLQFEDIITCFQGVCDEMELKNILINIDSCSKSLFSIQHLHMKSTTKERSKRRRILNIMEKTDLGFCVRQSKNTLSNNEYHFDIQGQNSISEATCFDDFNELRDRARLIEYAHNNKGGLQNYTEDDIKQLQSFISLVETIEAILKNLTLLNIASYPIIEQFLIPNKQFSCSEHHFDELDKFKFILETQLQKWESYLCSTYEKCVNLTYFLYQQVWMVENFLYNQTTLATGDPGYHLLKFINIDPLSIRPELLPRKSEEPNDRLTDMAQILNSQCSSQNSLLQEDGPGDKKVFLIETSNKGILHAIYTIFQLNNTPVIANQLFYCTIHTNWMEIRAFIYRCFFSQTLHQLIRPELLSLVIQDNFIQLFNQLIKRYPTRSLRLGIIIASSHSQIRIIDGLRIHHIIQTIHDKDMIDDEILEDIIQKSIKNNCLLVTSRIAGLGKSTYIRNEILRLGQECIKFPIEGDMDTDSLGERLRTISIQSKLSTIAIHLNIGSIENVEQLNDFLYCFILFRCFRLGQMPVYVPTGMPIYIELDASPCLDYFKDEIVIFKYLKTKHLDRMNWDELQFNSSRPIQLVTNYLQAIEDETIRENDIHEDTIVALDKPTCIHLLQKYFLPEKSTEFVSWTQLSIFIAIYYKLFSGFSQCGHFLVDPEYLSSLREDLLKNLLSSSNQFTTLSVETVRKNQRSIHGSKTIFPFSEAIIRWDKSQPFTVILTATHDPLFVYKTLDAIPRPLINAFQFYYHVINEKQKPVIQSVPQRNASSFFNKLLVTNGAASATSSITNPKEQLRDFLLDHNKMTHEQFFLRLTSLSTKYYTEKSICEKCFKQYAYNDQQCTMCPTKNVLIRYSSSNSQDIEAFQKIIAKKLQSEYILTADNYIKMLLIYLRVQSGLPVLIMGETGKINTLNSLVEHFFEHFFYFPTTISVLKG